MGLQAIIGFPMENEIKKKNDEMKNMDGMGKGGGVRGDAEGGGEKAKSESKPSEDMVRVSWKFPLYLTVLLLLGAAGTAFLDGLGGGGAQAETEDVRFRRRG